MCLILNPCYKLKTFTMPVYWNFYIIIVKSPCVMVIVLNHTAYRNINMKFIKNLQCNVHLSSSTIHHYKVRVHSKPPCLFLTCTLSHSSCKTSCKYFSHTLIIIRPFDRLNLELSIIIFLRSSVLKYNH